MQMYGIAFARVQGIQVLEICTAINSLEVINVARGIIHPYVV
jgi:hypothetical protein